MTSKNLFFNIMREDFKRRLWTVALVSLFFFFTFPVTAAMMISEYMNDMELLTLGNTFTTAEAVKLQFLDQFAGWLSIENGLVMTFIVIFAVVCGATGFSYLHSKKKTDFFHSIPVKREKLFAASFINGILYTAVPYLVFLLSAVAIVQIKTGISFPWMDIFGAYLFQMTFYILIYSTAVLAVVMTGNTVVSLLGMLVFCAWGPSLVGLIAAYCQEYFKTYYFNGRILEQLLVKSSPIAWYVHSAGMGESTSRVLMTLAAALVICALAVVLYRIRPSEAAGKAMAFKKSEPVIKFLIVVPMALFGSMVFRQMRSGQDLWSVFGLICGCIITYCIMEIIYNFDFRRLFSHKIQLVVCGVASLGLLAFFQFDLIGYDKYIPAKDKVESSAIYSYDLNGDALYNYLGTPELIKQNSGQHYMSISERSATDYLNDMQLNNTDAVLALAQAGIRSNQMNEDENIWTDLMQADSMVYTLVNVKYHMKNGKDIYRSYRIPLQEAEKQLETIYNTPEYKMATYPVLKAGDLADFSGVNYEEFQDYRHISFSDEAAKNTLIATYQEELAALSYEARKTESPIASIQFKTKELQGMIDILKAEGERYTQLNEWGYYPIYPSFTKTIELLKKSNINVGNYINSDNVEKIELVTYEQYDDNYSDEYFTGMEPAVAESSLDSQGRKTMIIKDKAQIEEVLKACVFGQYVNMNQLNDIDGQINVTAYMKVDSTKNGNAEFGDFYKDDERYSEEYETFRLYFDKDKIPEFVENQLLQ